MSTQRSLKKGQKASASPPDADDLAAALGVDASTLPDLSKPATRAEHERETADEWLAKLVADHAVFDLNDDEADLLAHSMFKRIDERNNGRRVRKIFSLLLFVVLHGVELRDVPTPLIPDTITRGGLSSAIHRWCTAGVFERAAQQLACLPFEDWDQTRRKQLASIVEYERRIRTAYEKRRNRRLYERATRTEGKNQ